MINSVTITNHLNESITMEMRFPEKSGFLIKNIEGLGPSKAEIENTEISGTDGGIFNSARTTSRNIVFELGFLENPTIEDMRHNSYKYFPIKKRIKIEIETDTRTLEVYGYVESNEPNIFSNQEGTVISIICPDAYLYDDDIASTIFSSVDSLFEFPFSNESLVSKLINMGQLLIETTKTILYTGDATIGMIISIHAIGVATGVELIDIDTLEKIEIDDAKLIALTGSGIVAGDDIVISTVKGDKYARLIRGGVTTNILNVLGMNPPWFELEKGDNIFVYNADSGVGNLQFKIENRVAYEGV